MVTFVLQIKITEEDGEKKNEKQNMLDYLQETCLKMGNVR